MIPELGQLALVLALILAIVQGILPLIGAWRGHSGLMAVARPAATGQFVFVAAAFAILAWSLYSHDFSVRYVAVNSNLALPWYYRIAATWGNHEGSVLLWILIFNVWTVALATFSRHLPQVFLARVLAVMGLVGTGFLMFSIFTSNPFLRLIPMPADGDDLSPLLQDPGMTFHPPMLYMGYVGFSVAFAFSIAALLGGELEQAWVRWSRPWTNAAWGFLTVGIVAGSWWSYSVLGWGGWWAWDPVENASFMPWLAGAALIHAQAVTEKRGSLSAWTLLLAIFAFSLSLLGTFLVRSGILTSVHAFATDPRRGVFILCFLIAVIGGSLLLYAMRAPTVVRGKGFAMISRESAILVSNLLLTVAAGMVLLGTLFPLIGDALHLGKTSVGSPYFGFLFTVLMTPLVLLLPFGPYLRWGQSEPGALVAIAARAGIAAVVSAVIATFFVQGHLKAIFGVAGAIWVMVGTLLYVFKRVREMPAGRRFTAEMGGMLLAHFGVGVFVAGVMLSESLSMFSDVRMAPGDTQTLGAYQFHFDGLQETKGPNWHADQAAITVSKSGSVVAVLHPQKRVYTREEVQTESAISAGVFRDIYVTLGEPMDPKQPNGAWAFRLYDKPFIRWLWMGGLFMLLGGFLSACEKRFRQTRSNDSRGTAAQVQ
ncbi:heme lyase CcmF/NrfE family subunit [Frateuria aurantia]|uniref:C-type cytochrome biogenesis protein CcmF n=1 Tax=Frateuria aurantia (strain ATCC 33424 / DSM 6220 / KCTC 2777 / LMG 1558 / NBRC 3245 / NCIMB 13370) TaxID=767434 RepID=H8L378_FRAAD|nr:heme lyase CcmF/NrfE family subunit [Frateuria aurantia]AFC85514.1 c-type cytochrome biogenesis protein CcmF [Frateuria aurantia DSM 6220]